MTYILAPERDENPKAAFQAYGDYLRQNEARFPPSALALVTSDWYLGSTDHRAPHDAKLQSASFEEGCAADDQETPTLALKVRLLSAYQDLQLEFRYPRLYCYTLGGASVAGGHGDWRYDEFRVTESGHLLHEIQWWSSRELATWLIEADDVIFRAYDARSATH